MTIIHKDYELRLLYRLLLCLIYEFNCSSMDLNYKCIINHIDEDTYFLNFFIHKDYDDHIESQLNHSETIWKLINGNFFKPKNETYNKITLHS